MLPTLCASYTRQHELARYHLEQKGIFACVQELASGFHFFDPAMFCLLFGATEHVVLSEKVSESFHFIGNAITVPHSLLALGIVFRATSECKIDPIGMVRQAWADRLSAYNAILFDLDGLVHLINCKAFWEWISIRANVSEDTGQTWLISGTCADREFAFRARPSQTLQQVFQENLSGPASIIQQLCGLNPDIRVNNESTIEQIACQEPSLRLVAGFATLGVCDLHPRFRLDPTKPMTSSRTTDLFCRRLTSGRIVDRLCFGQFSRSSKHCKTTLLP